VINDHSRKIRCLENSSKIINTGIHGGILPNNAQAGFVSVVVGAGAAWFGLYVNKGRSTINVQAKSEVRDNV